MPKTQSSSGTSCAYSSRLVDLEVIGILGATMGSYRTIERSRKYTEDGYSGEMLRVAPMLGEEPK
jgi:hypothetical protein